MPRALFWEPSKVAEQIKGEGDRNEVLKILIETFGRDPVHPLSPIELTGQHVFLLDGLGANSGGSPSNYFTVLADLIRQHGKIRVWGRD